MHLDQGTKGGGQSERKRYFLPLVPFIGTGLTLRNFARDAHAVMYRFLRKNRKMISLKGLD